MSDQKIDKTIEKTVAETLIDLDKIYRSLEDDIVALRIPPGSKLSENALCQRFHVSRTPIRSVMQRLAQNGFVRIISRRGTIVTRINLQIVSEQIYERIAVESAVFRDFIKICTPDKAEKVRYSLGRLQQLAAAEHFQMSDFIRDDLSMHSIWFSYCNKEYLWKKLIQPSPDYSRFIRLDMVDGKNIPDVLKEHQQMMDMIDARQTEGVEELFSRHLYGGIRRMGQELYSEQFSRYIISSDSSSVGDNSSDLNLLT